MRIIGCVFFFLCGQLTILGAQEFVNTWDVFIAGQRAIDVSTQDIRIQQLSFNTMTTLHRLIGTIKTRRLSSQEIEAIRRILKKKTNDTLTQELQETLTELDKAVLTKQSFATRFSLRKEIRGLRKDIRLINSLKLSEIPLDIDIPVTLGAPENSLSIDSLDSLADLAEEKGVFHIIYYQFEILDDEYVAIDIYAYNALLKKEELITSSVLRYNSFETQEDNIALFVSDAISGQETGTLKIDVVDEQGILLQEAAIYVDEELLGFGSQRSFFVKSGTFLLTIAYMDQRKEEIFVISGGEELSKTVRFGIRAEDQITVVSAPSQAKVYRNSQYVGLTPISIEKPYFGSAQIELVKQGYQDAALQLDQDSKVLFSVTLVPQQESTRADRIQKERKQFYQTFAIFGASVLVPVFLNGFLRNTETAYAARGDDLSYSERARVSTTISALQYSYYGGIAISVGLGTWAIVELFQYLRASREYQDR